MQHEEKHAAESIILKAHANSVPSPALAACVEHAIFVLAAGPLGDEFSVREERPSPNSQLCVVRSALSYCDCGAGRIRLLFYL